MLPHRNIGLELVDQAPARLERLGAVRRRRRDDDGEVTHDEVADPVHARKCHDVALVGDALGDVAQPGERSRVRRVTERRDALALVVVADRPDEHADAAGRRVGHRGVHLVKAQRRVTDVEQAYGSHIDSS